MPRAAVIRLFAASAWPLMQWAHLHQDRDAVPSPAGGLGHRTLEFSQSDTAAWRLSWVWRPASGRLAGVDR